MSCHTSAIESITNGFKIYLCAHPLEYGVIRHYAMSNNSTDWSDFVIILTRFIYRVFNNSLHRFLYTNIYFSTRKTNLCVPVITQPHHNVVVNHILNAQNLFTKNERKTISTPVKVIILPFINLSTDIIF